MFCQPSRRRLQNNCRCQLINRQKATSVHDLIAHAAMGDITWAISPRTAWLRCACPALPVARGSMKEALNHVACMLFTCYMDLFAPQTGWCSASVHAHIRMYTQSRVLESNFTQALACADVKSLSLHNMHLSKNEKQQAQQNTHDCPQCLPLFPAHNIGEWVT